MICSYEDVIEELQREKNNPYNNSRSRHDPYPHHKHNDNKMQLDTNIYVSNLLRKLKLLEEQLRFEKNEKLKHNLHVRQLERELDDLNRRRMNQSYEDDFELIEQLVFELESEKNKSG
jgi:hypothetical protein